MLSSLQIHPIFSSEWVKNMVGGESDLSGLDEELDSILFSDRYKGIRRIWRLRRRP